MNNRVELSEKCNPEKKEKGLKSEERVEKGKKKVINKKAK